MGRKATRAFMAQFLEMVNGATTFGLVAVAERIGLFKELAGQGPLTLDQIVSRTGLVERYCQEIVPGLAAAGLLVYDADAKTFELPDEHAACLADEANPYFVGGWTQIVPALYGAIPGVARAAREGGGVPFQEFGEDMVAGLDRASSPGTRILLVRRWLAAMPDVIEALERGGHAADVGCGSGAAVLTMAKAFPKSTVVGFDIDSRSIERARASASEEGVENAVFKQCSADDLPDDAQFDLIAALDVVHDLPRPIPSLTSIRKALGPDGTFLMVEPSVGEALEDNLHPGGAMLYAMSTLHCMTQSLAQGGEGLGAAWGAKRAEEYCHKAGFGHFERLAVEHPTNAFFRVQA